MSQNYKCTISSKNFLGVVAMKYPLPAEQYNIATRKYKIGDRKRSLIDLYFNFSSIVFVFTGIGDSESSVIRLCEASICSTCSAISLSSSLKGKIHKYPNTNRPK